MTDTAMPYLTPAQCQRLGLQLYEVHAGKVHAFYDRHDEIQEHGTPGYERAFGLLERMRGRDAA